MTEAATKLETGADSVEQRFRARFSLSLFTLRTATTVARDVNGARDSPSSSILWLNTRPSSPAPYPDGYPFLTSPQVYGYPWISMDTRY